LPARRLNKLLVILLNCQSVFTACMSYSTAPHRRLASIIIMHYYYNNQRTHTVITASLLLFTQAKDTFYCSQLFQFCILFVLKSPQLNVPIIDRSQPALLLDSVAELGTGDLLNRTTLRKEKGFNLIIVKI